MANQGKKRCMQLYGSPVQDLVTATPALVSVGSMLWRGLMKAKRKGRGFLQPAKTQTHACTKCLVLYWLLYLVLVNWVCATAFTHLILALNSSLLYCYYYYYHCYLHYIIIIYYYTHRCCGRCCFQRVGPRAASLSCFTHRKLWGRKPPGPTSRNCTERWVHRCCQEEGVGHWHGGGERGLIVLLSFAGIMLVVVVLLVVGKVSKILLHLLKVTWLSMQPSSRRQGFSAMLVIINHFIQVLYFLNYCWRWWVQLVIRLGWIVNYTCSCTSW